MAKDFDINDLEPDPKRPALYRTPTKGRHRILPGIGLPPPDFIAPLAQRPFTESLPDLDVPGRLAEDAPHRVVRPAPSLADTETLLNGLIGECGFLMREVAFRCIIQTTSADDRVRFLNAAMNLAETGAKVAESVGRLRGVLTASETRQRLIVEHVQTAAGEGAAPRSAKQ
ncbi:MAG: hypothetical protein WDN08_18545 [Rhizomicrobium sp.]